MAFDCSSSCSLLFYYFYDFSTLYTTLHHNLIKEKLVDLIEHAFKTFYKTEGTLYLACNDRKAFFTSTDHRGYTLWSCQNVCDALSDILDNIYIRFGNNLYRQIVGIPMDTNCAPLVADLFLFCYERDFGFEGWSWVLIASIPVLCILFTLTSTKHGVNLT